MLRRITMRKSAFAAVVLNVAFVAPAAATVVGQWNMDNDFGTTMADTSGTGNNGTTYNVVTSGSGYIFDGTSKAVVPNSASLIPGTNDFSYSAQIQTNRVPPLGTDYDIVRKGTGATTGGEFKLEIVLNRGVGKAYCVVRDTVGNVATIRGLTNVTDGQLHTLTCTKTATSFTLQVDSLAPQQKSAAVGSITNTKELTIGVKTATITGTAGDWYYGTIRSASVSVGP